MGGRSVTFEGGREREESCCGHCGGFAVVVKELVVPPRVRVGRRSLWQLMLDWTRCKVRYIPPARVVEKSMTRG